MISFKIKIVSICIPTFRRMRFLEQCISRMIKEIEEESLQEVFEIVVFNDNDADDTSKMIKKYISRYHYILYFESKKIYVLRHAIIHVLSLARGKYIWFFSDDDLPSDNALSMLLTRIKKFKPDIVFGNVDDFKGRTIVSKNAFKLKNDIFFRHKKDFFVFLGDKFFSITYFISYISNFIIKRKLYKKYAYINKKYDSPYNMTPLVTPVFYTNMHCNFLILSKSVVLRRIENESWALNDPKEKIMFSTKVSNYHFGNIQKINFKIIPMKLHLYFHFHRIKNYCINSVLQMPFGFQVINTYTLIENFFYQTLIKLKKA